MSDAWTFWRLQLAHQQDPEQPAPDINLDEPAQHGFFLMRWRATVYNDAPDRKPGDPRKKVHVEHLPVAFWNDGGWTMLIGKERWSRDPIAIESTFARACRHAITEAEYERMRHDGLDED